MIILPHRRKSFRGGAFDPTSITGCQLWLDASDSATLFDATSGGSNSAINAAVLRWEDKSGNARNVTSSSHPTRKSAINGLDYLEFSGANSMFLPANFSLSSGGSLFIVCQRTSDNGGGFHNFRGASFGNHTPGFGGMHDSFASSIRNVWAESYSSALQCYSVTAGANWQAFRNGSSIHGPVSNTPTNQDNSFQGIGSGYNSAEYHAPGNYCEFIIYNSALGTSDREAVESYLMTKWGI
jgi:hypothetical protein